MEQRVGRYLLFLGMMFSLMACEMPTKEKRWDLATFRPEFNEVSAYHHIRNQVSMGYRIPGSLAHKNCQDYIRNHLIALDLKPQISHHLKQTAQGLTEIYNIIGTYNPTAKKRIFLATHYDSRFESTNSKFPNDAANNSGSGVAMIMELASQIATDSLPFGIDFIFFDGNDQGQDNLMSTYGVGSQAWVQENTQQYEYGIVINKVGNKNATFVKEEFSGFFCGDIQEKIWQVAKKKDLQAYFPAQNITHLLIDDHYFINNNSRGNIPTLLITDYRSKTKSYFPQWHQQEDQMNQIDKNTLKAVGQVILEFLYLKE
ncbi:MAG: M28 family peptidase [Flavobacteriales bacterium]|nr:M28 family peptidase [Flavobacteriales bacterium]